MTQIMNLALTILGFVAYSAMTFFVSYTFNRLRRLDKIIGFIYIHQKHSIALQVAMKIRSDIDMLDTMRRKLNRCLKNEDFEAAEKLKSLIAKHMESMVSQIQSFKEDFGDIADIDIEIISNKEE